MKLKINYGLVIMLIIFVFILFEFLHFIVKTYYFSSPSSMTRRYVENFDSAVQQKNNVIDDSNVPDVKFPFKNCRDQNGKKLNVIMISAPFRTEDDEKKYLELKNGGMEFCGISSYLDFPGKIINPYEDRFHEQRNHDYISMVKTWLYCFREEKIPDNLTQSRLPMMLMAESDLKDTEGYYKPDPNVKKEYDFMYICLDDDESKDSKCQPGWQWYNRNWDLAKKCLEVMCRDYNLKGYIVGRTNCKFTDFCSGIVKVVPFMDFHTFQSEMKKCKWLFVPNVSDASPRVMTEAMCYNMPVLTNYDIIGGWHNVVPGVTGEFFTDENNIREGLDKLTQNYDSYTPRKWYCSHRGRKHSGKQLAKFLKENYHNLNNPEVEWADI